MHKYLYNFVKKFFPTMQFVAIFDAFVCYNKPKQYWRRRKPAVKVPISCDNWEPEADIPLALSTNQEVVL